MTHELIFELWELLLFGGFLAAFFAVVGFMVGHGRGWTAYSRYLRGSSSRNGGRDGFS